MQICKFLQHPFHLHDLSPSSAFSLTHLCTPVISRCCFTNTLKLHVNFLRFQSYYDLQALLTVFRQTFFRKVSVHRSLLPSSFLCFSGDLPKYHFQTEIIRPSVCCFGHLITLGKHRYSLTEPWMFVCD